MSQDVSNFRCQIAQVPLYVVYIYVIFLIRKKGYNLIKIRSLHLLPISIGSFVVPRGDYKTTKQLIENGEQAWRSNLN